MKGIDTGYRGEKDIEPHRGKDFISWFALYPVLF